jgi:hypothetical protein
VFHQYHQSPEEGVVVAAEVVVEVVVHFPLCHLLFRLILRRLYHQFHRKVAVVEVVEVVEVAVLLQYHHHLYYRSRHH